LALIATSTCLRLERPAAETRLEALNLAGTPAALVTLHGGGRVLVDTGLAPGGARAALDDRLSRNERLAAVLITRDLPSAVGGLEEVIRRHPPALLLIPPEASAAHWVEPARAAGVQVATLRPGLTVGRAGAYLQASPARERGRWQITVRAGSRTLTLGDGAGDAGIRREGRTTTIYATTRNGELRAVVRAGDSASVSSDGERLRLRPPRNRPVQFVACPPACHDERCQVSGVRCQEPGRVP
jgi:hypothetical protein